jgi:DNA mismatch repair protein MutS
VQVLTLQILLGLQAELAAKRPMICMLLDSLALLDVLSGFVKYMEVQSHVSFAAPSLAPRPGTLSIQQGYHPMHGSCHPVTKQQRVMKPNSCSLSTFSSLNLLFGANSSGKSTYLQQTGLLVIMAQAGVCC